MLRAFKGVYHLFIAILSLFWFRFPGRKLTLIGVTGTDGKTTTTTLIYQILKKAGVKVSMITSVNAVIAGNVYDTGFHVTTPNSYYLQKYLRESVNHGDTHMVLEVTSHALSQYRVFGLRFATSILTNITHEHLDWHGTYENYLQTKLSLLKRANVAIVNRDDASTYNKAIRLLKKKKIITYGIRRESMYNLTSFPFKTKLPGIYNLYNCLAAIACTSTLGIRRNKIEKAISEFSGIKGRMEVLQNKPFRVIVDFAHTPNALEQALDTTKKSTQKRIIHVFGSAGLRDHTKRPMMGKSSNKFADVIVLTEEDYRTENVETIMDEISTGITQKHKIIRLPKRDEAIAYAIKEAKSGDTVLITGKGHEQSLCRGNVEYPWSDQVAVQDVLKQIN